MAQQPDLLDDTSAAAFVERFVAMWGTPDIGAHEALWCDDIVLTQPLMGTLRGHAACSAAFRRLFRLVPDLRADVHGWAHDGRRLYISLTLHGTFGGRRLSWDAVDHFTLRGGRVQTRVSYFDPVPIVLTLARRPRGWGRLVRSRLPLNPSV
jgi:ketosteroid isomerase-like protein